MPRPVVKNEFTPLEWVAIGVIALIVIGIIGSLLDADESAKDSREPTTYQTLDY